MKGPSHFWKGSWMISRSANSSSRNGSTSSSVAGPPRFIITMPVFALLISHQYKGLAADQARLQGEPREPRHGPDVELTHQALAVGLHRAVADAELHRDLAIGVSRRYPDQHLPLPGAELPQCARR